MSLPVGWFVSTANTDPERGPWRNDDGVTRRHTAERGHASPQDCVVFMHIPKTAGSTLSTALVISYPPQRTIRVDPLDRPVAEIVRGPVGRAGNSTPGAGASGLRDSPIHPPAAASTSLSCANPSAESLPPTSSSSGTQRHSGITPSTTPSSMARTVWRDTSRARTLERRAIAKIGCCRGGTRACWTKRRWNRS